MSDELKAAAQLILNDDDFSDGELTCETLDAARQCAFFVLARLEADEKWAAEDAELITPPRLEAFGFSYRKSADRWELHTRMTFGTFFIVGNQPGWICGLGQQAVKWVVTMGDVRRLISALEG